MANANFSAALQSGQLWVWGVGTNGALGQNTTLVNRSSPVSVVGAHSFVQISLGADNGIGLKSDGTAWAWGKGDLGKLGEGTAAVNRSSPISVIGNHSFIYVCSGEGNMVGLKADGSGWCWGVGSNSRVGDAGAANRSSPVALVNHTFTKLLYGEFHGLGLKSDGTIWTWGFGNSGRLGNNATTNNNTPSQVVGSHSFVDIFPGVHSLALKSDGAAWAWGTGTNGQLGQNTSAVNRSSPVSVIGNHSFIQLSAGNAHSIGLKSDGTAWAWGAGTTGELGEGSVTVDRSSPISVVGAHSFIQIWAGNQHTLGLKSNGQVWTWGVGTSGQLGEGSTAVSRSSPVLVVGTFTFDTIPSQYPSNVVNITVTPSALDIASSIVAPTFVIDTTVTPSILSITSSIETPQDISSAAIVNVSPLDIVSSIESPSFIIGATITPVPLDIVSSIQSPIIPQSIIVTPSVLDITSSILSPNISTILIAAYGSRILSINPLIFVTNTSPATIVKVDTTDPENLTWEVQEVFGIDYLLDAKINENTEFVYMVGANGLVCKIDINDLTDQTIIDLSDTDDLQKIDLNVEEGLIYVGTENNVGEMYLIDERETAILNSDLEVISEVHEILDTDFNCIEGFVMNSDITVLGTVTSIINCDFKCLTASVDDLVPIKLTDFVVYIDNVQLNDVDVDLSTIEISHTQDEKSITTFKLNRRHDNMNKDLLGNTRTITSQNVVKVTIRGVQEFEGKISNIECQYSNTEGVFITATSEEPENEYANKTLPLPDLDGRLHLFDVLIQNPQIFNPFVDANDTNPEKYKGIFLPLGKKVTQSVTRYTQIDTTGSFADKIQNGKFNARQNWTYFWSPKVTNFNPEFKLGSNRTITFAYIGTSLSPVSSDLWNLERANHRYQRLFANKVQRLGDGKIYVSQIEELNIGNASAIFSTLVSNGDINGSGEVQNSFKNNVFDPEDWNINLTISVKRVLFSLLDNSFGIYLGDAPYKEVSASRNDVLIPKFRWEDHNDGLYSVIDEAYDFREFCQIIAQLELKKLKNINDDILPDTSCTMSLAVDAYYYWELKLLNRINVNNTINPGEFFNNNGFPLAIKQIKITASDRKVTLTTDNAKTAKELKALDRQYPNEEEYIDKGRNIFIFQKSDMDTKLKVE